MPLLTQLYALLAPLRLYSLGTGSQVDSELAAYGAGFAFLERELEQLAGASLFGGASGEGLESWEQALGLVFEPALPLAQRQNRLLWQLFEPPLCTVEHFRQKLNALGWAVAELEEDFSARSVQIKLGWRQGRTLTEAVGSLQKEIPAHLEFTPLTTLLNWQQLDARGASWQEQDSTALPWSRLDVG